MNLTSVAGASNVPTVAKQILVSDIDRHIIVFGTNPIGSTDQDPLLIRFGSQESLVDFTPTANTAGDLRLGSGSTFVQAVETKQQILVFTDKGCIFHEIYWSAIYIWITRTFKEYYNHESKICNSY